MKDRRRCTRCHTEEAPTFAEADEKMNQWIADMVREKYDNGFATKDLQHGRDDKGCWVSLTYIVDVATGE